MEGLEVKIFHPIVKQYEGDFTEDKKKYNGSGILNFDNSAIYNGYFQNGLFHGKGTFTWPDNVNYEGDFADGHIAGLGKYIWPDESKYIGEVYSGKRHGNGNFDSSSNQHYEGLWENGFRHGHGTMYYNQNHTISYNGNWKKDKRHGYGTMTYESGNIYEGEWYEDRKCGRGVMIWNNKNEIYLGEWKDDEPNGIGEHIWCDSPGKSFQRQICNIYRGSWKDGMRHGYGSFFYANGSQYVGEWYQNMKHGKGTFIHSNGKIFFGQFDTDRMITTNELILPTPNPPPVTSSHHTINRNSPRGNGLPLPPSIQNNHHDDTTTIFSHTSTQHSSQVVNSHSKDHHVLRETDSVNPQYILNIDDVLSSYPVMSNKMSHIHQTNDIERLILRYNTSIRQFLKKYSSAANIFRTIQNTAKSSRRDQHPSLRPPTAWGSLDLLIYNKRAIHEKFFTLHLHQIWQFARDCDLIGPLLTAYDVSECVRSMHNEHSQVSRKLHKNYLKQQIQAHLPPPLIEQLQGVKSDTNISVQSHKSNPNTIRKKSATTRDGNDSLTSSRSNKGPGIGIGGIKSTRDKDESSQTSRSINNKNNNGNNNGGLDEFKDNNGNRKVQIDNGSVGPAMSVISESTIDENGEENFIPNPKIVELNLEIEQLPFTHPPLPKLLDVSFEQDIYFDPTFPIREREFVELIVRIIAEATCRKQGGLSSGGLFDAVYRIFAEVIEPLASENRPSPVFMTALYSESVQLIIRKRASSLHSLWDQVLEIARTGNKNYIPQVKHVIKLMQALRGTAISEQGSSVIELLEVINKKGPNDDVSSLDLYVTYDDFVELFCRLVVSHLWIFAAEDESAGLDNRLTLPENEGLRRSTSRVTTSGIIEQALAKRLSEWLKLI
mmetsp:Transcript_2185/g.2148  ORF Transcript_2185/g.2148 Transcript_2185/m.2148 type:complete len:885 (-) Transcript_2185:50-2704(-)